MTYTKMDISYAQYSVHDRQNMKNAVLKFSPQFWENVQEL